MAYQRKLGKLGIWHIREKWARVGKLRIRESRVRVGKWHIGENWVNQKPPNLKLVIS